MSCVLLSGPPGAGKSTVARLVAQRLGGTAVDLDRAIEERTGSSAADLLRSLGEKGFRTIEAEALVGIQGATVIALGGGTLSSAVGRREARKKGIVVGLSIPMTTLAERLSAEPGDRPLLRADGALEALLTQRSVSYRAVDQHVDALGSPEQVAERIVAFVQQTSLLIAEIGVERSRVALGCELSALGSVAALEPTRPVLLIADAGVPANLRAALEAELRTVFSVHAELVPGGEPVKRFAVLEGILERAASAGCGRQSVVVGVGGGAVCDLAGMVAALLGRGAPLVLVPTTLLAQVDASVGGKCAINLEAGRNLAGVFHPATDVVIDAKFLASLPAGELRSGAAEALKMAAIADAALFDRVTAKGVVAGDELAEIVKHKSAIVARDPYERGERKILNFGHTLGHALEQVSSFALRHGEAVAIGMAAMARLGVAQGWTPRDDGQRLIAGLERFGLPTTAPPELLTGAAEHIGRDKKADQKEVDVVFLERLGAGRLKRLDVKWLSEALVESGGRNT